MIEELKKIGLSENEAKVYMALLELGSATVQEIAKKSGVNRPTTYVQLENLMNGGLASLFEKQSPHGAVKTFFKAEDPEHLLNVLEKEKKEAHARENMLQQALPELAKLFVSAGERPRVRFFQGIEGLRTIQEEFLKTADNLIEGITSWDDVIQLLPKHKESYSPKRIKKGIKTKMIYTSSRGPIFQAEDAEALRESYLIPADKFPVAADIAVSNNMVSLIVLKEKPFGIIIENQHIADSIRSLLRLAFEAARKYN